MKTRNTTAVWLEKYGRWQIKVTNEDGIRKTFTSPTPGRKGQTECNKKADEWLSSLSRDPNMRCGELIDAWLDEMERRSRTVTLEGKEVHTSHYDKTRSDATNWIRPVIHSKKIGNLRLSDLQMILDNAYEQGVAKKTIQNIRGAISLFLTYCRKKELTSLTAADLDIPKDAPVGERKILQPKELQKLFSCEMSTWRSKVVPEWYIHAWRFAVVMGLRPGELFAIEKKHISGDRLLVRGAINYRHVRTKGKNENALRDVALFDIARDILEEQYEMLKKNGVVSPYVFPAPDGSPASQFAAYEAWNRYCKYNGIEKITPYEMRHTFVSISSAKANLSIADLRTTIGHSRNMDTLGTYSHALTDTEERIAMGLNTAFSDVLNIGQ